MCRVEFFWIRILNKKSLILTKKVTNFNKKYKIMKFSLKYHIIVNIMSKIGQKADSWFNLPLKLLFTIYC